MRRDVVLTHNVAATKEHAKPQEKDKIGTIEQKHE